MVFYISWVIEILCSKEKSKRIQNINLNRLSCKGWPIFFSINTDVRDVLSLFDKYVISNW